MTPRSRLPVRIVELGFFALLGLAATAGAATAQPAAPHAPADNDGDLNYIVLQDGKTSIVGDDRQLERVRALRNGHESIVWFREAGQDYLSRDPALLGQLDQLWKPVQDIATQQGKIAEQQGKLAEQQGQISNQIVALSGREVELASRETELDSRDDDKRQALRDQRRELRRQSKELERPMHELSNKMNAFGRDMSALGRKMEDASARANLEVRVVLRRAITSGAAKPMR